MQQLQQDNGRLVKILAGTNEYRDTAGSDIVVITAGLPRKSGMSRDELLQKNYQIVKSVTEEVVKRSPDSILIVVSNPLDAMVYTAWKSTGFPTHRIVGQAGCLDVARYRTFVAMELGVSVEDVSALLRNAGSTIVIAVAVEQEDALTILATVDV